MRKLLAGVLWVLFVSVFVTSAFAYSNSKYGFSIDPPSGWTVDEPSYAAVVFIGPTDQGFRVNINIQVESTDLSLGGYVSAAKANLQATEQDFQIISEGTKNKINSVDAYELVYTFTYNGQTIQGKQVYMIKGGNAFITTYSALPTTYQNYLTAAESSIETLNLEPTSLNWLWITITAAVVVMVSVGAILVIVWRRKRTSKMANPPPPPPTPYTTP